MILAYLLYRLGVLRDRLAAVHRCRTAGLDDMPGHPERVRPTGEPVTDAAFWDAVQALLDDPEEPNLADVNDRWGWAR